MRGAKRIFQTAFLGVILVALLCPRSVHAQQITSSTQDGGSNFNTAPPSASALAQAAKPPAQNPFQRPSSTHQKADNDDSADSLSLQLDRKWTTALAQAAFTAPPSFYSSCHNLSQTSDWDSVTTGAMTAYITPSYTSYVRMSGEFEMYGQKREAGATAEPGAQIFIMEWELAHLVNTNLGPLEVAGGRYRQQLMSYAAFANSPLQDTFLGYSGSAGGFETSVTLPDKNLTFSLRFGAEHLNATSYKAHTTQFGFSWTW